MLAGVRHAAMRHGAGSLRRDALSGSQDRGAECVAVRDDIGTGRFPSEENTCGLTAADDPKNFLDEAKTQPKTCDTIGRDTHCVCKKPDNPACLGP